MFAVGLGRDDGEVLAVGGVPAGQAVPATGRTTLVGQVTSELLTSRCNGEPSNKRTTGLTTRLRNFTATSGGRLGPGR